MWDELSVERDVADDELATAVARALGIDRERISMQLGGPGIVVEKHAHAGDFALRVALYNVPDHTDRISFYRVLASALTCKLLVDDGDMNPYTAMLVTPNGDAVRVNLDAAALDGEGEALVIAGLHEHVYSDEVPDVLIPALRAPTKGEFLAQAIVDYTGRTFPEPTDRDAFMAAYTPEVQDAEHTLTELFRQLVTRSATPADLRVLNESSRVLHRAFPRSTFPDAEATGHIHDILQCVDFILAAPWDPHAPGV